MTEQELQRLISAYTKCCKGTFTLMASVNVNIELWLESYIDCCENLCDLWDDIIDTLEDWAAVYSVTYTDFICREYDNEDIGYIIEFVNYLCQLVDITTTTSTTTTSTTLAPTTTTTTTVDPSQLEFVIEFDDHLCQMIDDPDITTTTSTTQIIEEIEYWLLYTDFVCQQEDNPLITTTTSTTIIPPPTTTTVNPTQLGFAVTYTDFICQQEDNPLISTTTTSTTVVYNVSFEIEFDGHLCQLVDFTTTTTTLPPTTTTSTTEAPTTTTSTTLAPTTTSTTTLYVNQIDCNNEASGGNIFPAGYEVNLGAGTGWVTLTFDTIDVPDKFIVEFDGVEVINTGYRGDPSFQVILYDALNSLGVSLELISGSSSGTAMFYKGTATTTAFVKVYAPIEETEWSFTLSCPEDITTTTIDPTQVDYEVEYEDFICVEIWDGSPTTTTSTTEAPTTTTSTTLTPSTTTTTTFEIPCNGAIAGSSGAVFPFITNVNIGTGTGNIEFNFDGEMLPDKFIVEFDGVEVINTGYRGDPTLQPVLDAALADRGLPSETIQVPSSGTFNFYKSTSTSIAKVYVYAPLPETKWSWSILCPEPITTTTSTTTSTTTLPPTTTTTTTSLSEVCYGYLYNNYSVTDPRDIAPVGWHVPSQTEWETLITELGGSALAGGPLKETGTNYWASPNTGATNSSGFTARGSGTRYVAGFTNIGLNGYYQTTYNYGGVWNWVYRVNYNNDDASNVPVGRFEGYSCRLIKDDSTDPGIMLDNDGNVYPTTKIGTQVWMAANLKTTKYQNGDPIPNVTDQATWNALTTGAYCIYDNEPTDCSLLPTTTTTSTTESPTTTTSTTLPPTTTTTTTALEEVCYGYLYNWWSAIGDTDGDNIADTSIANTGWHLPSYTEYYALMQALDPTGTQFSNTAAGAMKETGFVYWDSPNTGATNSSKFNARGASFIDVSSAGFGPLRQKLYLWNAEEYTSTYARSSWLQYNSATFYTANTIIYFDDKANGFSVRLVKDSTTLSEGESGTYIGNDGKVYRTICIGGVEWLADNLKETKYRNLTNIPHVTDRTTWDALTNGAYCIYDNKTDDCDLVTTTTTTTTVAP